MNDKFVIGSPSFQSCPFGHGGPLEHIVFRIVVLFYMRVKGGVREVGFTTGATVVTTLLVSSISTHLIQDNN
jgi:hypothetical protein